MSKLQLNDDGTVTLPLRKQDALELPEPSIAELATMTTWAVEADAMLPDIPQLPQKVDGVPLSPEELEMLTQATTVLRQRTEKTYSAESPYGSVIVKIVRLLAEREITLDDLPSWAASPQACRSILGHWQSPLVGED